MDLHPDDPPALPTSHPAPRWEDQSTFLTDLALTDLEAGGLVRPTMVAFTGPRPLFLATLRPFEQGEHHDPVIEVGALAAALGADRVVLSLSGRAWSIDDPIAPVLPGVGDLRQRVIVLHQVDAAEDDPIVLSTILPYDVDAEGSVALGPALTDPSGQGFVTTALLAVVETTRRERRHGPDDGPDDERDEALGAQILRCERLGHQVAWSRDVGGWLQRVRVLALDRAQRRASAATAPAARRGW